MAAIFLLDAESRELVFRAGVDPKEIQKEDVRLRFNLDENETGRAFREGRVLKLEDHPFQSKVLVPIVHGPIKIGMLVLGHTKPNAFSGLKESEVLAATSRLGDLLEEASVLIEAESRKKLSDRYRIVHGRKASGGMARGTALQFWFKKLVTDEVRDSKQSPAAEMRRFDQALKQTENQLEFLKNHAAKEISETGAMIFTVHLLMLKDRDFIRGMKRRIGEGESAAAAVDAVVAEYASRFSGIAEVRLAEKALDVRDLGFRLITNLSDDDARQFSHRGRIALARHIYPSELMRLTVTGISGIVLTGAALTAHISILAQSLDVPVLITDDPSILDIPEGTPLCLDAENDALLVDPPGHLLEEFEERLKKSIQAPIFLDQKGKTADGIPVQVTANVNILKDAETAIRQGAEGIGLYRSEFPFILRNDFLSEEQQFQIYRSIVHSHFEKPVVLRTADIGGDKILRGREQTEDNPFLGVRGIRFSLANREMFQEQLRAMLRAGVGADIGIMLPMVSDVEEVIEAKSELARAIEGLENLGVPHNASPKVGAMIELPSAALSTAELAAETDFLSIGTNDLIMYLLAVDRTNDKLSHLYKSHHPSVLSMLASIAAEALQAGTEISVCGDAAADPVLVPFFVGIGIRKLSVSPNLIDSTKLRLSRFTEPESRAIAAEMLAIKRVSDMERYLEDFNRRYPVLERG
jgi:phosphoenolpyruvate-protein phosphotransferase